MLKRYISTLALLAFSVVAFAQTVTVSNADFAENTDYFWTKDNTYVLDDLVFIKNGSRLFIEEGTLIQGNTGTGNNATGLVITRGAQIFAEGTKENPIIFTSVADQRDGTATSNLRGLWGGVVVLGAATTNNVGNVKLVEGVDQIASPQSLAEYGGDNDADNSGVIRYVSIRHTGIQVGDVDGNEIQGLTLGGVGSGTTIEFVESFASNDDGFEFFGGTVNTKYLVSAFNSDDAYDWDEGFRGKGQFWFAIQNNEVADGFGRAMELDGATGDENTEPFAKPVLSNITMLGAGTSITGTNEGDGSQLVMMRDNTGGFIYNSIFGEHNNYGITIEDIDNGGSKPFDSRQRLEAGDIALMNNLWFGFGAGTDVASIANNVDYVQAYLGDAANNNAIADPALGGTNRTDGANGLDPRPAAGGPAYTQGVIETGDSFFSVVNYVGAFGATNWLENWTALDEHGYLAASAAGADINVSNADFAENMDYFWTADNTYILDDLVFIKNGSRLFIEPGTLIKGATGTGNNATGLVITRGAQIFAEGTKENPIIFTSVADQRDGTATSNLRGLWGGVVVLGAATTNNVGNVKLVEGVDQIASPQSLAEYGGDNDADNSGVIRYVSIRHTGIQVGDVDGNEIQGLTLGGVGSGTTIEFVESFASNDDGFEFFGGTVNTKYLVSAFNSDDAYDWDEGFRGKGQFWFAIQNNEVADGFGRAMELDGATGDENTEPFAKPVLSNITMLGAGTSITGTNEGDGSQLVMMRDNTGGFIYNSIFGEHNNYGITIEDIDNGGSKPFDSRQRLEAGDLKLESNIWYGFGAGSDVASIANNEDYVQAYLGDAANNNAIVDPQLLGTNRTTGAQGLDPRPAGGSAAFSQTMWTTEDAFFTPTNYVGAFGELNWMEGWTVLAEQNYLGTDVTNPVDEEVDFEIPTGISLEQNYPNPFNPTTNISFSLPQAASATIKVYDLMGRVVATLAQNERFSAGQNVVTFDATNMASGVYIYQLVSGNVQLTRKMTLIK